MNHCLKLCLLLLLTLSWTGRGYAGAGVPAAVVGNDAACKEGPLAQFGQYLGDWEIADSALSQSTGAWEPGQGARWVFVCVGDGIAVQDYWMPNNGGYGTNLRSYRSESDSWDVVWSRQGLPGLSRITAKQSGEQIVMHYLEPLPTPNRRITFFPAAADSWRWKLEIETAEGEWQEVYRIRASRRTEPD